MVLFYRWSSCQVADHEEEDSESDCDSDIEIENETVDKKIFTSGSIEEIYKVPTTKAVAIVSRGRMGRNTFTYMRRMLKPSKESAVTS